MVDRLLTDRQAECLRLVCQGLTEDEIAEALGFSVQNVRVHVRNIRYRLHNASIAEVCRMVERGEAPPVRFRNRSVLPR